MNRQVFNLTFVWNFMKEKLESIAGENSGSFDDLMLKWRNGNFYQQWVLEPIISRVGEKRLNRNYMCWVWPSIGNYVPGKDQAALEKSTDITNHLYTWSGIVWNIGRNVVKFGAAAYLFTHDVKEGSFILNLAGDLSAGGLALYGGVATAELIRRSVSCIKTDKPTAQISVELTAKGLGGISNFLKTTFGKSRKGLYINGEASENSSE